MHVLLAGGAGFIGLHVAMRLSRAGHQVTVIDNFSTACDDNAQRLGRLANCRLVRHDVCEPVELPGKFDLVMNLACPASPVDFEPMSLEILEACSRGARHLLDVAVRDGATFLQASTSECYGDPLVSPQNEDYRGNVNTVGPRSVYDEGKRFAEALTMAYHRRHGVPVRIARIFNTYGPHMRADDGRAMPTFIMQALRNKPLTVYGDGTQTRSFCYVDDLVDGLLKLVEVDYCLPVNLGNPQEITVLQLANEVIKLANSSSVIEHKPPQVDDPKRRCPDITLARRLLGWTPTTGRPEGIRRTIQYFREKMNVS